LVGLGLALGGLATVAGLVLTVPPAAHAAAADAAGNQYVIYLVLPNSAVGESAEEAKSAGPSSVIEVLSGFSLASAAATSASGGRLAVPASSSATATMGINKASVLLLTSVAAGSRLSLEVDFHNSGGALAFSYKFTNAVFTSYLLADEPTGESVQVSFAYQRLEVEYASTGSQNGPPPTYVITKGPGS
jgi:type VI protein secretion system component Hcp